MVTTLAAMSVVIVLAYSFFAVVADSVKHTNTRRDVTRLDSAAETVISLAVQDVWSGYLASQGGNTGSLASFRAYVAGLGITDAGTDVTNTLDLPVSNFAAGTIAGCNVLSVIATTKDEGSTTELSFTATVGSSRGSNAAQAGPKRAIQQTFVVEAGSWAGLDYALLANNVNCVMCHADIGSTDLFFNTNGPLAQVDRIRVGTLENLLLRDSADSTVAGTLYVRGLATDKAGAPITDWAAQTLKSVDFDSGGKLILDSLGDATLTDLVPADSVDPVAMENLYLDYSGDTASMVDGYMPESFPPPFPDDGGYDPNLGGPVPGNEGNRVVDDSEFNAVAANANGTLAGGSIHLNNDVDQITTEADLNNALTTGNVSSLGGSTAGNVILTGTIDNPILLDGEVAINGDLIIQGYVEGDGSILVSGNIYVPSDLIYADGIDDNGNRTFGLSAQGQSNELAMAAGGSIIVGDMWYAKPKNGTAPQVTGDETGKANFVISEMGLFNRSEWTKVQPILPGPQDDIEDPSTWSVVNPTYDPDYLPRYYAFNEGGTIPFFLASKKNNPMYYDPVENSWVGKEHGGWTNYAAYPDNPTDPFLFDSNGNPIAVVQYLSAEGGWISDDILETMMGNALAARPDGTEMEIDALLYSNNSIYGMIGKSTSAAGKMQVNGAIVAPDVGLLVPGNGGTGLTLNYDRRLKDSLDLQATSQITMHPKLWSTAAATYD